MQDAFGTDRPFKKQQHKPQRLEEQPLEPSGELAIPIIESLACGEHRRLDAINVPNHGFIPNLPDEIVVEVPATSDGTGVHPKRMQPLPEPIAAMIRLQTSINKLLVEAFAEQSKNKLLQAMLLEPTVTSYRGAVEMVDEMLALQRDVLPPILLAPRSHLPRIISAFSHRRSGSRSPLFATSMRCRRRSGSYLPTD